MTKLDSKAFDSLHAAAHAVSTAVMVLKMEQPTLEAFLKEASDMENFGHVVNPTLYKNPERRAANAVVQPLFEAAVAFIKAYESHIARSKLALEKVSALLIIVLSAWLLLNVLVWWRLSFGRYRKRFRGVHRLR